MVIVVLCFWGVQLCIILSEQQYTTVVEVCILLLFKSLIIIKDLSFKVEASLTWSITLSLSGDNPTIVGFLIDSWFITQSKIFWSLLLSKPKLSQNLVKDFWWFQVHQILYGMYLPCICMITHNHASYLINWNITHVPKFKTMHFINNICYKFLLISGIL